MYRLIRSLLFRLPAESSHEMGLKGLSLLYRLGLTRLVAAPVPEDPVELFGLCFANPVGLAAGLDKNGDYIDALGALGFGFIEVGTVTPRPQPGNPRPRLFRLAREGALINRMGFNNKGLDHLVARLQGRRYPGIVGVNIGKNLDTPVERALDDYRTCLRGTYPFADYITVNLSSPNTPGLRNLQFGEHLDELLGGLRAERAGLAETHGRQVPLLVKIAPDMSAGEVAGVARSLLEHDIDGVIAGNTTVDRGAVQGARHGTEQGGLSGAPLTRPATLLVERVHAALQGRIPVIGVGGIMAGGDAADKIRAGASLVQLYSGFIYRGPTLIRDAAEAVRVQRREPHR